MRHECLLRREAFNVKGDLNCAPAPFVSNTLSERHTHKLLDYCERPPELSIRAGKLLQHRTSLTWALVS